MPRSTCVAVGCSLGRALSAPEGLAVSPDGRERLRGRVRDRRHRRPRPRRGIRRAWSRSRGGPVASPRARSPVATRPGAAQGQLDRAQPRRPLLYSAAFGSDAIAVFRRQTDEQRTKGRSDRDGITRKELIEGGADRRGRGAAGPGAGGVERALGAAEAARRDVAGMNVILFLTDQERAIQHFPPTGCAQNLPGMRRLQRHGLSFERAFTNACMCSPARSTLMTGYFPAQHGVKYTLEEDMPAAEYPQVEMPVDCTNLATVMAAAGYNVIYKGKWHCSKPATATTPSPPTSKVRLRPLESAGRGRQPGRPRGRRGQRRQRRALHGIGRRPGGRAPRACCST